MSSLIRTSWRWPWRIRTYRATVYEREDGIHAWAAIGRRGDLLELVFEEGTIEVEIPEGHDIMTALLHEERVLGFWHRTYRLESE
jgi:hypothetical protein